VTDANVREGGTSNGAPPANVRGEPPRIGMLHRDPRTLAAA
jgi:hypothetical protein